MDYDVNVCMAKIIGGISLERNEETLSKVSAIIIGLLDIIFFMPKNIYHYPTIFIIDAKKKDIPYQPAEG